MSDQKGADDAKKRLDRLKAMQARHAKRQPVTAPEAPAASVAPVASGASAAAPAPEQQGGGAFKAAGQNPIVQKLRKALTNADGSIDERKAKMLVQFIRSQAQDPDAPRHDMAKKLLEVVQNMDPEKRKRLLGVLGQGGAGGKGAAGKGLGAMLRGAAAGGGKAPGPAAGKADAPATGEPWFDDLVNGL